MNPVFSIFLGDSKTIFLRVASDDCCGGDPLDLTQCTQINIALPNADGTFTNLLLSDEQVSVVQPPVLGKFSAAISSEVSALLNTGEFQNMDVTFTVAGEIFTVRFTKCLSVFEIN